MNDTITMPEIGTMVRIVKARYANGASFEGMTGKVAHHHPDFDCITVYIGNDGIVANAWEIPSPDDDLQAQIADLTDQLYEVCVLLDQSRAALRKSQDAYRHDMGHFEQTMRAAKEDQNWCDEGTNEIIEQLNDGFIGGWNIEEYRSLVRREVSVQSTVIARVEVWVKEGDDEEDSDNWLDEEGDAVDPQEIVYDACQRELDNYGWDEWEVR